MARKPNREPDALELMEELVKEPTIDMFFEADPSTLSREQLAELVTIQRRDRALFITKGEK